jgi:L-lactate dehydrogenase
VEKRIPLPLAKDEEELMQKSAESIQAVLRGNGVIA